MESLVWIIPVVLGVALFALAVTFVFSKTNRQRRAARRRKRAYLKKNLRRHVPEPRRESDLPTGFGGPSL